MSNILAKQKFVKFLKYITLYTCITLYIYIYHLHMVLSYIQLFANLCTAVCPGSSVHGIFQTQILEWAAISFSRGSSQTRDQTCVSCVSCMAGRLTAEPLGKSPIYIYIQKLFYYT